MEDLVKKISQYQLFNFLLSGTILAFLISKTTPFDLLFDNLLLGIFVYYFMGFIVSRVGSLLIEPLYKFLHITKFISYDKYLAASKQDVKIDILSQENNTYRTLIAMLILYILIYVLYLWLGEEFLRQEWVIVSISGLLILLLSMAYRKQTKYIVARANVTTSGHGQKKSRQERV
jgi:hypothetical protein